MKKILLAAALVCAVTLGSCCRKEAAVSMGSLSQFDSLSYALGANIGFGMGYEYRDIPFDYDRFYQGVEQGALDKSSLSAEQTLDLLRDYFVN